MAITLTLANAGLDRMAQMVLNKGGVLGNITLKLYKNNHAPLVTDTPAAFTEPTAAGYASVALAGASWTGSTAAGLSDYTYPATVFTFTNNGGGETIFGCFFVDTAGNLLMAGLLDTAFVIPVGGGTVTINPEWQNKQC
jgi:hypothetical protein